MRARKAAVGVIAVLASLLVLATVAGWLLLRWWRAPSPAGMHYAIVVENQTSVPLAGMRIVGPGVSVVMPTVSPGATRSARLDTSVMGPLYFSVPSAVVHEGLYEPAGNLRGQSGTLTIYWRGLRDWGNGVTFYGMARIDPGRNNPSPRPWPFLFGYTYALESGR
jgi:hypothetical protein